MKHMLWNVAIVGIISCTSQASHASTLLFDFGDAAQPSGGNYNNVTAVQSPILNAIDSTGAGTGIGLESIGFNELGPNNNGTTTPGAPGNLFDPQATRDSLFGHSDDFNAGSPRPTAVLSFTGLDGSGATLYGFTFFASRLGVTDNRETQYAVQGANSGIGFLDASGNSSGVATVSGIVPTAAGGIDVTITKGPNNNNGSGFYYLGALQVVSTLVPEPSSLTLAGVAAILFAVRRRVAL